MCGSTVDIQSPTALRLGEGNCTERRKKERKKTETTAAKYNGLPLLWAAINIPGVKYNGLP